ncbi:Heat shock protein 12A [Nymphon striatum]|nr:Heat shock protein 12A [Nymphon striatum]
MVEELRTASNKVGLEISLTEAFWIHKNKQPTCVLLLPSGQFHSFGFDAQINYHDLEVHEDKHRWMYFDKFKMALHNTENLTLDTEIRAVNGQSFKAIVIFSHVLAYFKSLVLKDLTDSTGTTINNDDVRWVITVPAIWRQPAKQFMRAAAYNAGLASEDNPSQILIALEPEAASLYCRQLKVEQLDCNNGGDSSSITKMPHLTAGTRYMVVDCGGGTVDITVYEVDSCTENLRELHKATGGPYGSVGVDIQFQVLMNNIFGKAFIETYKKEVPQGFVYLMLKFESRKICATVTMNTPLNIELPYTFIQAYQKYVNDTLIEVNKSSLVFPFSIHKKGRCFHCESSIKCIQKCVENCGVDGVCFSSTGMLRINPEVMLELFRPTVARVVQHIREVLLQPRISYTSSSSPTDSNNIRYIFSCWWLCRIADIAVIIPRDVSISILHGAVLFGLNPSVVSVRCSRMTYGVGILNYYDPDQHPADKKFTGKDGVEWCTDVFDKFVTSNQSVGLGETVCRSYTPASSSQRYLVLHVYMSENENPKFITDRGVVRCGTLGLDLHAGMIDPEQQQYGIITSSEGREVQVIMTFGDTEIKADAVDMATNKCVAARINFLI